MKTVAFAGIAALMLFGALSTEATAAGWRSSYRIGGSRLHSGRSHLNIYRRSYSRGLRGHSNHGHWYHDTSHYDWHPGSFQRHRNHYHYVPGHYDYHQTGHWHHGY